MKATELRRNIFKVLDKIAATGVPVEIERNGKKLKIICVGTRDKFANAKFYKDCIVGDPDNLDRIDWLKEWKP